MPPCFPPPLLISTFLMSSDEAALTKAGGREGLVPCHPPRVLSGVGWGQPCPLGPLAASARRDGGQECALGAAGGEMLCPPPYPVPLFLYSLSLLFPSFIFQMKQFCSFWCSKWELCFSVEKLSALAVSHTKNSWASCTRLGKE